VEVRLVCESKEDTEFTLTVACESLISIAVRWT